MNFQLRMVLVAITIAFSLLVFSTFERPPVDSVQRGYRGLGMVHLANPRDADVKINQNQPPAVSDKLDPAGQPASAVYQNVQVLGDVDSNAFLRLMNDITAWVSPEQGCAYCHKDGEELSADTLYTKVVARKMFEMTRKINVDFKNHVQETGVTCHTCHRGKPVPENIWFNDPGPPHAQGALGDRAGQNAPARSVGHTSLPYDPFTPFFEYANDIRVISGEPLPGNNRRSIKQAEWTYGLMMHMSQALGVNCTFCHNTRSFVDWDQSTPQRTSAFHGIRMVRDLNMSYITPIKASFPPERLGPLGDVPKINCTTCHQGAYKPLFGASILKDYPELARVSAPAPAGAPAPTPGQSPAAPGATPPVPGGPQPGPPGPQAPTPALPGTPGTPGTSQ